MEYIIAIIIIIVILIVYIGSFLDNKHEMSRNPISFYTWKALEYIIIGTDENQPADIMFGAWKPLNTWISEHNSKRRRRNSKFKHNTTNNNNGLIYLPKTIPGNIPARDCTRAIQTRVIDGVEQIVILRDSGLYLYRPYNGKFLMRQVYDFADYYPANIAPKCMCISGSRIIIGMHYMRHIPCTVETKKKNFKGINNIIILKDLNSRFATARNLADDLNLQCVESIVELQYIKLFGHNLLFCLTRNSLLIYEENEGGFTDLGYEFPMGIYLGLTIQIIHRKICSEAASFKQRLNNRKICSDAEPINPMLIIRLKNKGIDRESLRQDNKPLEYTDKDLCISFKLTENTETTPDLLAKPLTKKLDINIEETIVQNLHHMQYKSGVFEYVGQKISLIEKYPKCATLYIPKTAEYDGAIVRFLGKYQQDNNLDTKHDTNHDTNHDELDFDTAERKILGLTLVHNMSHSSYHRIPTGCKYIDIIGTQTIRKKFTGKSIVLD